MCCAGLSFLSCALWPLYLLCLCNWDRRHLVPCKFACETVPLEYIFWDSVAALWPSFGIEPPDLAWIWLWLLVALPLRVSVLARVGPAAAQVWTHLWAYTTANQNFFHRLAFLLGLFSLQGGFGVDPSSLPGELLLCGLCGMSLLHFCVLLPFRGFCFSALPCRVFASRLSLLLLGLRPAAPSPQGAPARAVLPCAGFHWLPCRGCASHPGSACSRLLRQW